MSKTLIEWVKNPDGTQGYTLNDKTGCRNHTPEGLCLGGMFPCYAFKLANGRLKQRYLNHQIFPVGVFDDEFYSAQPLTDPFYPRWWSGRLKEPYQIKKPAGFFLDDMSDWMGDYWPKEWTEQELQMMRDNPQHRIYTLTKQPQNLIKFSPFPDNCWVGVTATEQYQFVRAVSELRFIEAPIKYLSFEPLLAHIPMLPEALTLAGINWVIIGAVTGNLEDIKKMLGRTPQLTPMPFGKRWTLQPKIEWVEEIVRACGKAGIPVFLKDNLKPLFKMGETYSWATSTLGFLRQEMPK
ncbi:MAG TPA: DUF5131 family protein [Dehalococcoidia bacterium]|nr:DUF5131 family protein [Dehalococcoidia bacterium]